MERLKLAISPCPNDTFIFYGMIHQKVDTKGFQFEVDFLDIQALNNELETHSYDIIKVSYVKALRAADDYHRLRAGGALGIGVGPLLINKGTEFDVQNDKIAIPGKDTTAHFLFNYKYPNAKNKIFASFETIEDLVLEGKVDAGVIIHENRFTYADKGLNKVVDLGEYWEEQTQGPIPLGAIMLQRKLEISPSDMDKIIISSIKYAYAHQSEVLEYCRKYAQNMDEKVMQQHIDLYVNEYSLDIGKAGEKAILTMSQLLV